MTDIRCGYKDYKREGIDSEVYIQLNHITLTLNCYCGSVTSGVTTNSGIASILSSMRDFYPVKSKYTGEQTLPNIDMISFNKS